MLETVLQYGTGKAAAIGQFAAGKTGTTSNYGDAWFVGWDSKYTVAVWVGFPNSLVPMTTDFDGGPVLGGTYPALIWHDFMISALQIDKTRAEEAAAKSKKTGKEAGSSTTTGAPETSTPATTRTAPAQAPGQQPAGAGKTNGKPSTPGNGGAGNEPAGAPQRTATPEHAATAPSAPAPTQEAPATPAPSSSAPQAPSSSSPAPVSSPQTGGVSPGG